MKLHPSTAVKAILPVTFAEPGIKSKNIIDKNKEEIQLAGKAGISGNYDRGLVLPLHRG